MRKLIISSLTLACALPAYAQEPDPAQMLARPRPPLEAQQFSADYEYCRQFGAYFRNCMADLNQRRRPVVVAPPPGYRPPEMTLCDIQRIDSDYSTMDCF